MGNGAGKEGWNIQIKVNPTLICQVIVHPVGAEQDNF